MWILSRHQEFWLKKITQESAYRKTKKIQKVHRMQISFKKLSKQQELPVLGINHKVSRKVRTMLNRCTTVWQHHLETLRWEWIKFAIKELLLVIYNGHTVSYSHTYIGHTTLYGHTCIDPACYHQNVDIF